MNNNQKYNITDWLPTTAKEVKLRKWDNLDVILFSGDAYIDHPSFGPAVIGRIIESYGYKIAIVPQPNWQDDLRDFKKLGKPNLFFGVTAGSMDSMVNHYTANKRLRSNDAYTPGNISGFRPNYPTIEYTKILKKLFPDTPVIIGGIEASLRRFTHFDYWQNKLLPSILISSGADLLVYGMGEKPIKQILNNLSNKKSIYELKDIKQTAFVINKNNKNELNNNYNKIELFSHEECLRDKIKFAKNFKNIETESNKINAKQLLQAYKNSIIVVNPPFPKLTEAEIDASFDMPYTRMPHPKYAKRGTIPAYETIKFSVNIHRGCFGGCSFCTISAHQGKFISSRSKKSIINEVNKITEMPDFKGYISDIGGPSANMYKLQGKDLKICDACSRPSCIFPKICDNLNYDHNNLTKLYKEISKHPKIKKAFIGSGIRYDLLFDTEKKNITKSGKEYLEQLIKHHISGRLKIAPEHTSDKVLKLMRKPSFKLFYKFKDYFDKINKQNNLNQQLIPYFISSHPASNNEDMCDLAIKTKNLNFRLEQIQDLTPTPMTLSTVIYYTGINPYTLEKIYTPKTKDEKLSQRKYFFWYKKEYRNKIINELNRKGQKDLIKKLFS